MKMKKIFALFSLITVLCMLLSLVGCSDMRKVRRTVAGNLKTYCEMEDGTWACDGVSYRYRLEIKGRLHGAACDSVYVYLSNIRNISFEQAWKAGGLSSNTEDYFAVSDAVLVEMRSEA